MFSHKSRYIILFLCSFFATPLLWAQVTEDSLARETDPEAMLIEELSQSKKKKEPSEKKELKKPKNIFYNVKVKKNFIKTYTSGGVETIIFYYTQEFVEPNPYLQNVGAVTWINLRKKTLQANPDANKEDMRLLHGSYKRLLDGKVMEEGYYYMGGKHGRWEYYDANFVLNNKEKYYHGWAKDAEITYYDVDRKKIKEVIPVHYGEKNGMYYSFYEGGQVQVRGKYEFGQPVGTWWEYYQFKRVRKKETRYPRKPFDSTPPLVVREWDEKGKVLYDRDRDGTGTVPAEDIEADQGNKGNKTTKNNK